jgi:hypothetical protein
MQAETRKRIWEIIPAGLAWSVLGLSLILSFIKPLWVIYFIIIFDLFWLFRVIHFTILLNYSWRQFRRENETPWYEEIKKLDNWSRIYHYILLPTAGESFEVIQSTFDYLAKSHYPLNKMIVHLAGEERCLGTFSEIKRQVEEKYGQTFFQLIITIHPDGQVGEVRGKGANAHYAGHEAKKIIDELGIHYEDVVCSYFDSDTCVHPEYLANLTYKYLTTPNPLRKAYQPAVLYNNNIWDAPAITRITAFGTIFWLMAELVRPDRMYTFSSHSVPFQMLVDVDFWQKDIVTDDSRIFLQGFFRYEGDFSVVPMYIPVSMDTVQAKTYWQSARNLYKQQRRWAWGTEHFPYIMEKFREHPKISRALKFKYTWNLMEGNFSWATSPILIFILGRLPLFIASLGPHSSSVIVQNTPYVLEWLMSLSMLGIFVSAIMSMRLLPPRPEHHSKPKWIIMILQWVLLPLTIILFGSAPALDAQTRLALGGKYRLGFWVTPKERK